MTYMDHVIVVIVAVLLPAYARLAYPRIREFIRHGGGPARIRAYRGTIVAQWLLLLLLMLAWIKGGRDFAALGFSLPAGWGFVLAAAITAAFALVLGRQVMAAKSKPRVQALVARRLRSVAELIPRNSREYRYFLGLSVTAGICEEAIYRGFLIWYLAAWGGPVLAVVMSSAVFGLAHSYQGVRGVAQTALIGIGLAGLFIVSGSLWAPIAAHALIDALSGLAGRYALGGDGEAAGDQRSIDG